MFNQPPPIPTDCAPVQQELHEIANLLRQGKRLQPVVRDEIAALLEELGRAVMSSAVPTPEVLHLARSASLVGQHLHEPDHGQYGSLRARLDESLQKAAAQAPAVVGIVRRLLDALADIGI